MKADIIQSKPFKGPLAQMWKRFIFNISSKASDLFANRTNTSISFNHREINKI